MSDWYDAIISAPIFGLDTEGTSLQAHINHLHGFSIAISGQSFWIPNDSYFETELGKLRNILEDSNKHVIIQNAVYDVCVLRRYDIIVNAHIFDTMIAAWLIDENVFHGLKKMVKRIFDHNMITWSELKEIEKKHGSESVEFKKAQADYAMDDARQLLPLYEHFRPQLISEGLLEIYENIYEPLIHVVVNMIDRGVAIDQGCIRRLAEEFSHKAKSIKSEMISILGWDFNPNSPLQIGKILYGHFGLHPKWAKKLSSGQISTSVDVLETISKQDGEEGYEFVQQLLQLRHLLKLINTYLNPIIEYCKHDGRLHANFNLVGTVTGRLSSDNPNLQNIPARTKEGRKIREAFIASESFVLVVADFSQFEIRIMADKSQDPVLRQVFSVDGDVHQETAERLGLIDKFGQREGRARGKTTNLGFNYDMGAKKFARMNKYTEDDANSYRDGYFKLYRKIKLHHDTLRIEVAKGLNEVFTFIGRKRRLYNTKIDNGNRFRVAVNSPIQGSAADFTNIAMIRIHKLIKERWNGSAYLLLQVHDELVIEIRPEIAKEFVVALYDIMCNVDIVGFVNRDRLSVPLDVDISVGTNWLMAKA